MIGKSWQKNICQLGAYIGVLTTSATCLIRPEREALSEARGFRDVRKK